MEGFKGATPNDSIENADLKVNDLGSSRRAEVISYNEGMPALKKALGQNYNKFNSLATQSAEEIIKKMPKLAAYLEAVRTKDFLGISQRDITEMYTDLLVAFCDEVEEMKNPGYASSGNPPPH